MKTTETLDKLYLEWSQFTGAKTKRELYLEATLLNALDICDRRTLKEIKEFLTAVCADFN